MRIYTRTGDSGETGLFGGQRVSKDELRVESYGTVDEASAAIAIAAAFLQEVESLHSVLLQLMNTLFTVGADLATPLPRAVPRIESRHIEALEKEIDTWEATLPPLQTFILPGGTPAAAALHQARTIVRRAERRVVTLCRVEPDTTNPELIRYLNRLSDLLLCWRAPPMPVLTSLIFPGRKKTKNNEPT
ncbi:MAG: cob(I)yrinic acid a,c-diamide adenosyltransferase [Armatimonas sp.]